MADWKAGKLLGAKYAVVGGSVHLIRDTKEQVREAWSQVAAKAGLPAEIPDGLLKQVVIILPPWEETHAP